MEKELLAKEIQKKRQRDKRTVTHWDSVMLGEMREETGPRRVSGQSADTAAASTQDKNGVRGRLKKNER